MNEPRSFASLSPSLLARKGAARPAMRPQLQPLAFEGNQHFGDPRLHDLGWNDMGDDHDAGPAPAVASIALGLTPLTAADVACGNDCDPEDGGAEHAPPPPVAAAEAPALSPPVMSPVQVQLAALAQSLDATVRQEACPGSAPAAAKGRKAAFTLRLDAERHLRLRLASTLQRRSAQQLLIEALDRMLDEMPGLNRLARQMAQN